MPLTKKGRKIKRVFLNEYGKRKGNRIFYAFANKHKGLHLKKRR